MLVERLWFQLNRPEMVEMVFFIDGFHVRLAEVGHVLYYHCNIAIVNVKLSHQGGSGLPHQIWIFSATFCSHLGFLLGAGRREATPAQHRIVSLWH